MVCLRQIEADNTIPPQRSIGGTAQVAERRAERASTATEGELERRAAAERRGHGWVLWGW